jgi:hypothetical protein
MHNDFALADYNQKGASPFGETPLAIFVNAI